MAKKVYKCVVSGKTIPKERVEALKMLGTPEHRWTCVEHAFNPPRKGIYLGEVGTSELLIVDKVYNDSVRAVFRGVAKEPKPLSEYTEDEPALESTYDAKELNYYICTDEQTDPEEKIEIIKRHET
jgi:hypothetical protein